MLTHILVLDIGERARDTLVGVVHRLVDGAPSLAVRRYFLSQMSSDASWKGTASRPKDRSDHSVHVIRGAPNALDALLNGLQGMPAKALEAALNEPRA